jgi:hypothetical protein
MRILVASFASFFSQGVFAACLAESPRPPVEFRVHSCQGVLLEPSPSRTRRAGGRAHLHTQSIREHGVLIAGMPIERGADQQGALHYYLVAGSPENVCPSHLPTDVALEVEPRCCDTLPAKQGCIAPFQSATFTVIRPGT